VKCQIKVSKSSIWTIWQKQECCCCEYSVQHSCKCTMVY